MSKHFYFIFLSIVTLFTLSGCVVVHDVSLHSKTKIDQNAKVAVIPFTGAVYQRSVAAEWFTHLLKDKIVNMVMSPAMVEKNLRDNNISLEFKQESKEWHRLKGRVIQSQPSSKILKSDDFDRKYEVNVFSTEDLIEMGKKLDADIVICGSVAKVDYTYTGLVEIQVIDIHKQSILGVFKASNKSYRNQRVIPAIEQIVLDVAEMFFFKEKTE